MIKAFMFDVDGTIINKQDKMPESTIKSLKRLKEKGYTLILNSGRPVFLCNYVTDPIFGKDFFDYVYGNNGSEFYDSKRKEKKYIKTLTPEQVNIMVDMYDIDMFTIGAYDKDQKHFNLTKESTFSGLSKFISEARGLEGRIINFKENKDNYPKIICLHEEDRYDESLPYIETHQSDFADVYHSGKKIVEIVPKGVSKGLPVEHLKEVANIKGDEIISFGDAENDIPMLKATNGIAMGNANENVLKVIKNKTKTVDDNGLYDYLLNNHYLD